MFRTHEPNVPDTSATPSGGALPPPGATAAPAPSAHDPRSRSSRCSHAIALVIDAMDLMHKGTLDGFCLVSSDSDFTRLAQRLREEGMVVYGFGEQKAVKAFRNACNRFIYVENLVEASTEESDAGGPSAVSATKKQPPSRAVKIIAKAIEDSDDDGWANLSGVGSRILGAKPDFDARSYGCPNLSTLVERSGGFEVRKDQGAVYIRRKAAKRRALHEAARVPPIGYRDNLRRVTSGGSLLHADRGSVLNAD